VSTIEKVDSYSGKLSFYSLEIVLVKKWFF